MGLVSFFLLSVVVGLEWGSFAVSDPLSKPEAREPPSKPLSVLLVSSLYSGHLFPLVALGEELVRRGHNVTLCANEMKGSNRYPDVPERVGIKFVSAGYDTLTQEDFHKVHEEMQNSLSVTGKSLQVGYSSMIQIRDKVEEIGMEHFDIVVCDVGIHVTAAYFHKNGLKSMIFSPLMISMVPNLLPSWPTPITSSGQSDDLSFLDRFLNTVLNPLLQPLLDQLYKGVVSLSIDAKYYEVLKDVDVMSSPGIHIPLVVACVWGVDFPKPKYPLLELVGPILMTSLPRLDQRLQEWLDAKEDKSVIYISMGTTASLDLNNAKAILDGVMATPHSTVWVINARNRKKIGGVDFEAYEDRLFMIDWVPQQTVLKHRSIVVTILHCGLNGVQESLFNSLPIICAPFGYDQFEIATRVTSAGVGFSLYGLMDTLRGSKEIKAETIENSINLIDSDSSYRDNVSRIRKMFILAGGVQRAADLVEFYEDVGYEHLVPSFAKYQWNWVQCNNVDVWLVLGVMAGVVGWVCWRTGRCLFTRLCRIMLGGY